ncbi:MAG: glycosyltransferase family 2 protein [Bacteroidota bacterium]
MQLIRHVVGIIEIVIFIYLALNVLYILVFAIAGVLRDKKSNWCFTRFRHITLLITAYKEDFIIESIIKSALQQDYPSENIEIILIADSFTSQTIESLKAYQIKLVIAKLNESTKVYSMQLALKYLSTKTDFVVVLDADNVMEKGFLRKLNLSFASGFRVFQCHRTAKNTNSSFALLDAISEEVNNNIFREGQRALGLSAALIGSAIAFEIDIYNQFIPNLKAIGGFDKELELELMKSQIKIEYLSDAYVYDEKVADSQAFYNQRRRWISAQLFYLGKSILSSLSSLFFHGNVELFNKTLQFSLFPRAMLLGTLITMNFIHLFFEPTTFSFLWLLMLILCSIAILISIPLHFYTKQTMKAILSLPVAFLLMVLILFRLKKANKKFIHTEHHYKSYL